MHTGDLTDIIGKTPLVKIRSVSEETGCEIWGKCEFLAPGGSVKDRAALGIILDAEKRGLLNPGWTIYEGTAGNTGIGLAMVAGARGYKCHVVVPDNQAAEKYQALEAFGATVTKVPPTTFASDAHFYHQARRLAESDPQGFWANQFENLANQEIHFNTTGPEIWQQTQGRITHFCAAAGTGGTIAGVSRYLKSQNSGVKCWLVDPMGSGLYHYIKHGEIKAEGSSVTEGIGIMRLTANFKAALIDNAIRIEDGPMFEMLKRLAHHDGLLVGPSAALNVEAARQIGLQHKGQGKVIVTILCDSGLRYLSKLRSLGVWI
ncbi:MAG: cysteine synthase A [Bdellovibrionaceae bacterium]|nr:cysteine synthase A [Pseudobdellovibrionaceae bacterium]